MIMLWTCIITLYGSLIFVYSEQSCLCLITAINLLLERHSQVSPSCERPDCYPGCFSVCSPFPSHAQRMKGLRALKGRGLLGAVVGEPVLL